MEIFTRKSFRFLPFCATLRCIGAKIALNYNNHHRREDDGDCCIGCLRNHLLHFHARSGILAAVGEENIQHIIDDLLADGRCGAVGIIKGCCHATGGGE